MDHSNQNERDKSSTTFFRDKLDGLQLGFTNLNRFRSDPVNLGVLGLINNILNWNDSKVEEDPYNLNDDDQDSYYRQKKKRLESLE